mmetsp:Transcript_21500/g.51298  ORF Transcript_21500/g.51298 Transcript_21500/m.51298 type:complete len:392 (+) Transcript_21500:228-1403(+)
MSTKTSPAGQGGSASGEENESAADASPNEPLERQDDDDDQQQQRRREGDDDDEQLETNVYCPCPRPAFCRKCGDPMRSRTAAADALDALIRDRRPDSASVFGNGPLLLSDRPASSSAAAKPTGVVLGIDEAGRGCSLGPMVYGCAYWSKDVDDSIPKGFRDSKQMKEEERNKLFEELKDHPDIGYALRSILPSEISRNMLRPSSQVYNLNQMSHDAAILLIRKVVDAGVNVTDAYIDTVGNPESYQRKLEREFPAVRFVVESKADANYAPCSAASVVAKVMRDRLLENWKFSESSDISHDFGSGYPSDPRCKKWMEDLADPVFGYPDIVRFSWAPATQQLGDRGVPVVFRADLDEEDLQQRKGLSSFLKAKRKRLGYFEKRRIRVKNSLLE